MSNIEPSQFATAGNPVDTPDDIAGTSAASGSEGIAEEHDKDAADILGAETRIVADEATVAANTAAIAAETARAEAAEALKAPLASPALTGTPTAPTAAVGTDTTQIATTAFVLANGGSGGGTTYTEGTGITIADGVIAADVGTAAGTVAAGNDSRITGAAPLASPTFTGTPAAPTAAAGTDTTQLATTAFAAAAVATETTRAETAEALKAPLVSPALTGAPTAPTAAAGTDTTQLATTAFTATAVATETTRAETAEAAAVPKSTVTTAGDLIVATGSGAVTRLAAGASGYQLTSSGAGGALSWQPAAEGENTFAGDSDVSFTDLVSGDIPVYNDETALWTNVAAASLAASELTPTAVKTAAYTAVPNDLVICSAAAGSFAVTLPAQPTTGTQIGVVVSAAGTGDTVTVDVGSGDTFVGGATGITLSTVTGGLIAQYNATTAVWYLFWATPPAAPAVPLSTVTTAGDLIVGTGAGAVERMASGAASTALMGTAAGAAPAFTRIGNVVPTAVTAAATVATPAPYSKQIVPLNASSAAFTVTLPDATTCTGAEIRLFKQTTDTSGNLVTVTPHTGQTIGGAAQIGIVGVLGHVWDLFSDGANWQVANMPRVLWQASYYPQNERAVAAGFQYFVSASTATPTMTTTSVYNYWYQTDTGKLLTNAGTASFSTTVFNGGPYGTAGSYWGTTNSSEAEYVGTGYYGAPLDQGTGLLAPNFAVPPSGQVKIRISGRGFADSTSAPGWLGVMDSASGTWMNGSQVDAINGSTAAMILPAEMEMVTSWQGNGNAALGATYPLTSGQQVNSWLPMFRTKNGQTAYVLMDNSVSTVTVEAV